MPHCADLVQRAGNRQAGGSVWGWLMDLRLPNPELMGPLGEDLVAEETEALLDAGCLLASIPRYDGMLKSRGTKSALYQGAALVCQVCLIRSAMKEER